MPGGKLLAWRHAALIYWFIEQVSIDITTRFVCLTQKYMVCIHASKPGYDCNFGRQLHVIVT